VIFASSTRVDKKTDKIARTLTRADKKVREDVDK